MQTFADGVNRYNNSLDPDVSLPRGIRVMNPFKENPEIREIAGKFYRKFYNDAEERELILGINPGRLGAGATGIPFTDTKRLASDCGIQIDSFNSHEPSSVFVYEVIRAYGGPVAFYKKFFINSMYPLGFVIENKKGNWVNCNYYDFADLYNALRTPVIEHLKAMIDLGVSREKCFVLGKKNAKFLHEINKEEQLFRELVVFDHPRYIAQYKSKQMSLYVDQYLAALSGRIPT
ncbi:SMUG2 DNA glycosylase family protein [Zeaxanthinibacter sp. PT1]|uniref:SMUG2 DNA glycosylase family protein n=1 Tax=Zeaxanthinibacter TaxID=561554 RepID=UPI002349DF53|nr:SMUG2 DNA glycosylase family protein [Zeaxanthinibacter sp. PT1]MDC6350365.1 SMUG2 DNA glycosylase family protein [Zeaxanthinibacter sp. PT1]